MARPITVIGGVNVDLIMRTTRVPKPGESLEGRSFQMALGGKASNQAIGVARLGGKSLLISKVGNDDFGKWIMDQLNSYGVDTNLISQHGELHSGVAMVTVDEKGENTIVVTSGAYGTLSEEDVLRAEGILSQASILIATLETPIETCLFAFRLARARGVTTILDPGPVSFWDPELLTLTDVVTPNETETAVITGIDPSDPDSWERAGRRLLQLGARSAVIKLGDKGALGLKDDETVYVPAVPVEKVVDTTGAGDAFNAGLAMALSREFAFKDAITFGVCCGGLAVTRPGAAPSMPEGHEVERLYGSLARSRTERGRGVSP